MYKYIAFGFLLPLTACDTNNSPTAENENIDTVVTETVLDDVDAIDGTISDAMLNVEELGNDAPAPDEDAENIDGETDKDPTTNETETE